MQIPVNIAKLAIKETRHPGCAGYAIDTPNGTEYDCAYDTVITCDECKYCVGRKDPSAKRNKAP